MNDSKSTNSSSTGRGNYNNEGNNRHFAHISNYPKEWLKYEENWHYFMFENEETTQQVHARHISRKLRELCQEGTRLL